MFGVRKKEEWKKAASDVQESWLKNLEGELSGIQTELPSGMKERLGKAFRDVQLKTEEERKIRKNHRPALRWAVWMLLLLFVFGSWLIIDKTDKTARADAVDWTKKALGAEDSAQDAYTRLIRFLGGLPGEPNQYRDPKGEAWRPYFGGGWLDGGKDLVIALTDDSPEVATAFRDVLQYEYVVFRKVKYSYDELYTAYELLGKRQKEDAFRGLVSWGIDVQNNQVQVSFAEETDWEAFLTWADIRPADIFFKDAEWIWIIRDQEDLDLQELTILLQNDLLSDSRLTKLGEVEAAKTPAPELPPERLQGIEEYMRQKAESEKAVLTDSFVQAYTEYSSVEEWRKALIKENMAWMSVPGAWKQVLDKLLPTCRFELDEARIREKTGKPEKAEASIREYLLVRAIAEYYGIRITAAEVQNYIKKHQIELNILPRAAYNACEWRTLRELVIEKMTEP